MSIDALDGLDKIINKDKLDKLKIDYADDIAYLAKGQNKSEVLEYYGLTETELSNEDKKLLDVVVNRAKVIAKAEATTALFNSMKDKRTAASSSLSYLVRFSNDWKLSDEAIGTEKFIFNMIAPK